MEDKVKVVIELPFRAMFHWTEGNWRGLKEMVGYDQLRIEVTNMLYSWLTKSEFSKRVVDSFDETWKILTSSYYPLIGNKGYRLTDEEKLAVASILAVPSTRHKRGSTPYRDGYFIRDPFYTRTVYLPAGLTQDEYIAEAYKVTGLEVLAVVVEGETTETRNAKEVFERVEKQRHIEKTNATAARTGVVSLKVFFPYRALFRWDAQAFARFRADNRARVLIEKNLKEINKSLSKEGVFANQNIVGEYDVAWWALNSVTFSGLSKNSLVLNDPLKNALIDALTIPGTRGVQGSPAYKDRSKPELGFITDEWLTRSVDVPYQPDGNYTNALRNIFGETIFWYEKQY